MSGDQHDDMDEYTEELRNAPAGPTLGHGPFREFLRQKKAQRGGPRLATAELDASLLAIYDERAAQLGVPTREILERALRRWLEEEAVLEKLEAILLERKSEPSDESAA